MWPYDRRVLRSKSPSPPQRPCRTFSCRNLVVRGGYCDVCARAHALAKNDERETSTERGYDATWSRAAKRFLMEHPLCARCSNDDRTVAASQVDHITPWRTGKTAEERAKLFWDEKNWQPLCARCHSRKTALEDGRASGQALPPDLKQSVVPVHVVCGPVIELCRRHVSARVHDTHVVIEVEHLLSATENVRMYECADHKARHRAMVERNRLLRSLAYDPPCTTAWFITPGERACDRRFWLERLGARSLTVVAPSIDVCLQSILADHLGGKARRADAAKAWWRAYVVDPSDVVVSCVVNSQ